MQTKAEVKHHKKYFYGYFRCDLSSITKANRSEQMKRSFRKMEKFHYGKTKFVVAVWCLALAIMFHFHCYTLKKRVITYSNELNNSKGCDQSYMILTRVPKTGSEMLRNVLFELSIQSGYNYYNGERMADKYERRGQLRTYEARKYYTNLWAGGPLYQTHGGLIKRTKKIGKPFRNSNQYSYNT